MEKNSSACTAPREAQEEKNKTAGRNRKKENQEKRCF
jgi:hypothetical protein